jgi:hypothetical protein
MASLLLEMEQIEISPNLATMATTNVKWRWTPWGAEDLAWGVQLFRYHFPSVLEWSDFDDRQPSMDCQFES